MGIYQFENTANSTGLWSYHLLETPENLLEIISAYLLNTLMRRALHFV